MRNWLRNRNTIEFLGVGERLNNPDFNSVEFDGIRMQAGLNSFTLTPKQWIEKTRAVGIVSQAGGGAGQESVPAGLRAPLRGRSDVAGGRQLPGPGSDRSPTHRVLSAGRVT